MKEESQKAGAEHHQGTKRLKLSALGGLVVNSSGGTTRRPPRGTTLEGRAPSRPFLFAELPQIGNLLGASPLASISKRRCICGRGEKEEGQLHAKEVGLEEARGKRAAPQHGLAFRLVFGCAGRARRADLVGPN